MRIHNVRSMPGPNLFNYRPVMVMELFMDDLDQVESNTVDSFNDRLVKMLPGLREHNCSKGRPGGLIERMEEGTYFSHIIEHVTLELMSLIGIETYFGKTVFNEDLGCYDIVVAYEDEATAEFLLKKAVELVQSVIDNKPFDLKNTLQEAQGILNDTKLGVSTKSLLKEAKARNIPFTRIGDGSIHRLGYGIYSKYIEAAITSDTSAVGVDIAGEKNLTKLVLRQAAIAVPYGRKVHFAEEALSAWKEIGGPAVLKPLDACHGNGVTVGANIEEDVLTAFQKARKYSSSVIVEEPFYGKNYRILIINGRYTAASERIPATVVGDGKSTIRELIEFTNQGPWRSNGHDNVLTKIVINEDMERFLKKKNMNFESVPKAGQSIELLDSVNLSTGGTAKDVTDIIHPDTKVMCERAARAVGLNICGIDLIADDISQPLQKSEGIIEVNASPGLRMHEFPSEGQQRKVAQVIIDSMFPSSAPSRIPIISVTGTNGKTTVTRLINHVISGATGKVTGLTSTDGIWIDEKLIKSGDMSGRFSAQVVLSDPSVEVAVLETARGGIMRRGLGYDWADIGVITNIEMDHIGQDGIKSIDDLIWVKSLIAERVKRGGTVVLNADNPHTAAIPNNPRMKRIHRRYVYFSLNKNNVHIQRNLQHGGAAFYIQDQWIVEEGPKFRARLAHLSDIPMTFNGQAKFNIYNILAAIAACRAYGLEGHQIMPLIRRFDSNAQNPGRANLFQWNGSSILLDYGHNPEAFRSVIKMASSVKNKRLIGVVGVPGDRDDSLIKESGKVLAQGFDYLIIKEDKDRRGRAPGETAKVLYNALSECAPQVPKQIVLDEDHAVSQALKQVKQGDLLVIFYEEFKSIMNCLNQHHVLNLSFDNHESQH
jgi:cyanophycin synthetase